MYSAVWHCLGMEKAAYGVSERHTVLTSGNPWTERALAKFTTKPSSLLPTGARSALFLSIVASHLKTMIQDEQE